MLPKSQQDEACTNFHSLLTCNFVNIILHFAVQMSLASTLSIRNPIYVVIPLMEFLIFLKLQANFSEKIHSTYNGQISCSCTVDIAVNRKIVKCSSACFNPLCSDLSFDIFLLLGHCAR